MENRQQDPEKPSPSRESDVIRVSEFVDRAEQKALQQWATEMEPFLKSNGGQRAYGHIQDLPRVAEIHGIVRERIETWLRLEDARPEPAIGWYLSIIDTEGAVHKHRDSTESGFRHLRCNLFIQASQTGGEPVIGGRAYPVQDRMLLCFFPSELVHWSLPARGPQKRILCSFGYLVPDSYSLSEHARRPLPYDDK